MNTCFKTVRWLFTGLWLASACTTAPVDPPPLGLDNSVQIGGVAYPTQFIGQQRWTTVNYSGPGGIPYGNGTEKTIYGRYYTLSEAEAVRLPARWRLPTQNDWETLLQSQGIVLEQYQAKRQEAIKTLLSATNWRSVPGRNTSGFNAYPAGYSSQNMPPQDGDIAEFWVANGWSMSIQETSQTSHLLRFYSNDNDPTVRYTLRFVSDR